jgi:hypothetical protein
LSMEQRAWSMEHGAKTPPWPPFSKGGIGEISERPIFDLGKSG